MKDKKIKKKSFWAQLKRDKALILIVLPVVIHYLVFIYYPMYGNIIAFKDYSPVLGITKSPWVGFRYFIQFFESPYFFRGAAQHAFNQRLQYFVGISHSHYFCADDQ